MRLTKFDEAQEETSYFGCQAGRNGQCVTVDGAISPCSNILALNKQQLLAKLGDIQFGFSYLRNRMALVGSAKLMSAGAAPFSADPRGTLPPMGRRAARCTHSRGR